MGKGALQLGQANLGIILFLIFFIFGVELFLCFGMMSKNC